MPSTLVNGAGNVVHVQDRVLASALTSLDIPLRQEINGAGWAGITNVYSEKHPARVNGARVEGRVSFYFEPRSRCGKHSTKVLVKAWNEAGEYRDGDPQPQGITEIDALRERLIHDDLTEEVRQDIHDRWIFWEAVARIQQNRVMLAWLSYYRGLAADPRRLPPILQYEKGVATGRLRFEGILPSEL